MSLTLDPWQSQVLETKGNICLRSGRQVGKSTIISIRVGEYAVKHPKKHVLVIAATERQAFLLFEKILNYLAENYKPAIKKGKDRPTKHIIKLVNGSVIYCLPTGATGYGIRGYTINLLVADEAAFIPEEVWSAVTPMLATTKGKIILLSTPHGREGYFARCFNDPNFTKFHISSEDCPRMDKLFLENEKKRMTKREYAQEYLGEFIDDLLQFFPDDLIRSCQKAQRPAGREGDYYLGVDVARLGGDESTFEIIHRKGKLRHVENIFLTDMKITDTINKIIFLDNFWNFRRIYIDDGGLGVGVFDTLLSLDKFKRRVVAINNAKRSIEYNRLKDRKKSLMKEDLYNNLLKLMENGEIALLTDPEIFHSLKSVQYEYSDSGQLKITGRYTHIAEGLIRAAWCVKDKTLNISIHYI